jgi:hypothetical protein
MTGNEDTHHYDEANGSGQWHVAGDVHLGGYNGSNNDLTDHHLEGGLNQPEGAAQPAAAQQHIIR